MFKSFGAGPLPEGRMANYNKNNRFSILDQIGDFPDIRPAKRTRIEGQHEMYLLMKSTDANKVLTRLSVFGVQKGLEGITSQISEVSPQRNGELLILAKTKNAAAALLKAKTLGGLCNVECYEHPFLNSAKAIIYCPALMDMEENDIVAGLKSQGVIEVRKIKKFKDGTLITTPLLIITVNTPEIPKVIKVGYLQVEARIYIPSPLRCTVCQKYGHGKKRCGDIGGTPTCGNCAEKVTLEEPHNNCTKTKKCANCEADHPSSDKTCSKYKQEAEITKIKTVDRVSFRVARQKYADTIQKQQLTANKFQENAITTGTNQQPSLNVSSHKPCCIQSKISNSNNIQNESNTSSIQNTNSNIILNNSFTPRLNEKTQSNSNTNTQKNDSLPHKNTTKATRHKLQHTQTIKLVTQEIHQQQVPT